MLASQCSRTFVMLAFLFLIRFDLKLQICDAVVAI